MVKKWVPFWAVILLIIFSIGTVWLRLSIVRTTYSINEVTKQIKSAKLAREKSELRLANLRSPRRLEILARSKVGLSHVKPEKVVHLK